MAKPKNLSAKTYLYQIVNTVNGNDYVGISTDPYRRWNEHKRSGRNPPSSKGECSVAPAIRKYGEDKFTFTIIAIAQTWEGGCHLERMARKLGLGKYNKTTGGEGAPGRTLTEDHKRKIALANKGKSPPKLTPEQEIARIAANKAALTPQVLAKRANTIRSVYEDNPELINKIRESVSAKYKSDPSYRQKVSQASTNQWKNNLEYRTKMVSLTKSMWEEARHLGFNSLKQLAQYKKQNNLV